MGVLKAAANAAEAPMGTSALTLRGDSPSHRPSTEAMPALTCTDGPSRPRAIPLASVIAHMLNFPTTVRMLMKPSRRNSAVLVCGIPLPRALGK